MPHLRQRYLLEKLDKYLKFWPVMGVLGLRQCGKTTLVSKLLGCGPGVTLDELEFREEARSSPKTFLARLPRPVVIDEVQKAPEIFDEIKLLVDRKRVPGEFVLTGSSTFSSRIGIRESLTGRIGLLHLRPLSMGELHQKPRVVFKSLVKDIETTPLRFTCADVARSMQTGGMPGVAFIRSIEHQKMYWSSWLEATLTRDLPRFFKRNYDPDLAMDILKRMAEVLKEGELPALHHFSQTARILKNYLEALKEIFVLDKITIHQAGVGKDIWLFGDCGLAGHLMEKTEGLEAQLALARHFLHNEWMVHNSLATSANLIKYYKTAQGTPVDAVIDGIPILVTSDAKAVASRLSWVERPIRGAMKKLEAKRGIIVAPVDRIISAKSNDGVAVVPWSIWS